MPSASGKSNIVAISPAATLCHQRQHLAEPLWFALFCREMWGVNAPKELQFLLGRSERTCRAWASGDSEPPAGVLVSLLGTEYGPRVLAKLMHDSDVEWWRGFVTAQQAIASFKI